jgi:hypothetical protein
LALDVLANILVDVIGFFGRIRHVGGISIWWWFGGGKVVVPEILLYDCLSKSHTWGVTLPLEPWNLD